MRKDKLGVKMTLSEYPSSFEIITKASFASALSSIFCLKDKNRKRDVFMCKQKSKYFEQVE